MFLKVKTNLARI